MAVIKVLNLRPIPYENNTPCYFAAEYVDYGKKCLQSRKISGIIEKEERHGRKRGSSCYKIYYSGVGNRGIKKFEKYFPSAIRIRDGKSFFYSLYRAFFLRYILQGAKGQF
jgi:hypothetical protein